MSKRRVRSPLLQPSSPASSLSTPAWLPRHRNTLSVASSPDNAREPPSCGACGGGHGFSPGFLLSPDDEGCLALAATAACASGRPAGALLLRPWLSDGGRDVPRCPESWLSCFPLGRPCWFWGGMGTSMLPGDGSFSPGAARRSSRFADRGRRSRGMVNFLMRVNGAMSSTNWEILWVTPRPSGQVGRSSVSRGSGR